jgi:uncharacterized membrane protein YbhN (UPF0104 family)
LVKVAIAALVVVFVERSARDAFYRLGEPALTIQPAWLVLSGALYLLALLPEGMFWHGALVDLGQGTTWGNTLTAYYIGHLGKYVPGKAMVVILRCGLLRGDRLDRGIIVASVFLETLTMMAVGGGVSTLLLAIYYTHNSYLLAAAAGALLLSGLPTLPPVFAVLARRLGVARFDPTAVGKLAGLRWQTLALGWIGIALGWFIMGASLWAAMRACGIPADIVHALPLCTAAAAMAVVIGFLSMIPAGLFSRDYVLFVLLSPLAGDKALVVAALVRIVWLLAEILISGILYVCIARRV